MGTQSSRGTVDSRLMGLPIFSLNEPVKIVFFFVPSIVKERGKINYYYLLLLQ